MPQPGKRRGYVKKLPKSELPVFTVNELRIIDLTCRQYISTETAEILGLEKRTVEAYKADILKKMKVRNAVGMALFAVKNGLVKL